MFILLLLLLLFLFWFGLVFGFLVLGDRVSLCSPGCPRTHSVDQAGLELRNSPASSSFNFSYGKCSSKIKKLGSLKTSWKVLVSYMRYINNETDDMYNIF